MDEPTTMQHFVVTADDVDVHVYCQEAELPRTILEAVEADESRLLKEGAGNWKDLHGPYRYRIDQAHEPSTGQRHIHVYLKNNQLFSLNWDGTCHDGFKGTRIPTKVFDQLSQRHPDLKLPPSKIIESIDIGGKIIKYSDFVKLRIEDASAMQSLNEAIALCTEFCSA